MAIEKEFKIKFNIKEIQSMHNVGDTIDLIKKKYESILKKFSQIKKDYLSFNSIITKKIKRLYFYFWRENHSFKRSIC